MNKKSFSYFVFHNKYLLIALITVIVFAGLNAINALPRTEDPMIINRLAFIVTPYPGASAKQVEALVTEPIEQRLRELNEINEITSNSFSGLSVIIIELNDNVSNVTSVWSRARDYINDVRAQLPPGVQDPIFDDEQGYAFTSMLAFTSEAGHSLATLKRYADELANQIRTIPGTDIVREYGFPEEEVLVSLNPAKLAHYGLTMRDISDKIKNADAKNPSGVIYSQQNQFNIELYGGFEKLERIKTIPILSNQTGQTLLLGDIATVKFQPQEPQVDKAYINGKPTVILALRMLLDIRISKWDGKLQKVVSNFKKKLPDNIKLTEIFNQKKYINARLGNLLFSLLLGIMLVFLSLFFTLGWRASITVGLCIPLTTLFTVFVLQLIGSAIQQMTVIGLIVALGILIDNAVVVTDMVQEKLKAGKERFQAVYETVTNLRVPLFAATITTVLAFMPIILLPGNTGEFVGGVSWAVIFSVLGSYMISLTIIVTIAGRFLQRTVKGEVKWYQYGVSIPLLVKFFSKVLTYAINYRYITIVIFTFLLVFGFIAKTFLLEQFFPPSDRNQFFIQVRLDTSANLQATNKVTERISSVIRKHDGVESVVWFLGRSVPSFYYNMLDMEKNTPYYAEAMVTTKDFKIANALIPKLQIQLDNEIPKAQILVRKLEQGPPFIAPIEIKIFGPDVETLQYLGEIVRKRLSVYPEVVHSRATLQDSFPKLNFNINEHVTRFLNLDLNVISQALQAQLVGIQSGILLQDTEGLPVRIRIDQKFRNDIDVIKTIPIQVKPANATTSFSGLPLEVLGDFVLVPSYVNIPHFNLQRVNIVQAYLKTGVLPDVIAKRWEKDLKANPIQLGKHYKFELGGEKKERNEAVANLLHSVPLLFIIMCVILILVFRSVKQFLIIVYTGIYAFSMGLISLFVFGYAFGFVVIIALLGLIGLAINAGIIILNEINHDPKAKAGVTKHVIEATLSTGRHIFSTTTTTMLGFLPLVIAGGEFWPPFAIAFIGGVFLTTLSSFIYVPAYYRLTLGKKTRLQLLKKAREIEAARQA